MYGKENAEMKLNFFYSLATARKIERIKQQRLNLVDERKELTEKYENENEEFVILIDQKTGKIKVGLCLHKMKCVSHPI